MLMTRPARSQRMEAAEELGVSVDHLRNIVRNHVVERVEDAETCGHHLPAVGSAILRCLRDAHESTLQD